MVKTVGRTGGCRDCWARCKNHQEKSGTSSRSRGAPRVWSCGPRQKTCCVFSFARRPFRDLNKKVNADSIPNRSHAAPCTGSTVDSSWSYTHVKIRAAVLRFVRLVQRREPSVGGSRFAPAMRWSGDVVVMPAPTCEAKRPFDRVTCG
jgi:hypothetical protein